MDHYIRDLYEAAIITHLLDSVLQCCFNSPLYYLGLRVHFVEDHMCNQGGEFMEVRTAMRSEVINDSVELMNVNDISNHIVTTADCQ